MIECSATADKAVVLVADTAGTVDGSLLSRLFMPFTTASADTDPQASMSVAGDIIQRHGGEITVRSSSSWKTILAISFPAASNSDRRARHDRRSRPADRRRSS
jgi:signal transduction histidine kinase